MCVHVCVCMYLYLHIDIYKHICIYMCVQVYIFMYKHTNVCRDYLGHRFAEPNPQMPRISALNIRARDGLMLVLPHRNRASEPMEIETYQRPYLESQWLLILSYFKPIMVYFGT